MVARTLAFLAGLLAELVAPSRCAACDDDVGPRAIFCAACSATVERNGSAFEYGGAIATAIVRLKYHDRADLGPRLAKAMLAHADRECDVVVPVPLHPRRLAERGYNQAALLAGPIAHALGRRFGPRVLRRVRDTPRQALLDRATRLRNVERAFTVRDRSIRGKIVLLVDDVLTTGATIEGATTALHEAGARRVIPLVLARRS